MGWEVQNLALIKYATAMSFLQCKNGNKTNKPVDSLVQAIKSEQSDYKSLGLTLLHNFVQNVKVVLLCCTTQ